MTFAVGPDHILSSVPDGWEFAYKRDNYAGVRIKPTLGVIHYGVTRTHEELERALLGNDYVSAHIAITGHGGVQKITQLVPFNIQAGHAGKTAVWQGKPNVNAFSIGVEINNPGPLRLRGDGIFCDVYGKPWDGEVLTSSHERDGFPWKYWAKYTEAEIAIVTALMLELKEVYGLVSVAGHDEIRRDKSDPGPAFPMRELRALVFPRPSDGVM
jgi:N-acetylmuramoyl-L-alanine amidase